jgi:peptidoglycan/xylan/chitin deacetylase (PgdA/CDA1 family)
MNDGRRAMDADVELFQGGQPAPLPERRWQLRVVLAFLSAVALTFAGHLVVSDVPLKTAAESAPAADQQGTWRPVANDCSGGYVTFTFDDGPRQHTGELLDRLVDLRLNAVFFWAGENILGRQDVVRQALAGGNVLGNHSFSHADMVSGLLPGGQQVTPWEQDQIRAEFQRTTDLLIAYGAPAPAYYRPPYGSVSPQVDEVATQLGLRLVMSYGLDDEDNIVDSHDSEGLSTEQITANVVRGMRGGSIITMHDGLAGATLDSIAALQPIVDVMNEKRLCASTDIRPDATGRALEYNQQRGGD